MKVKSKPRFKELRRRVRLAKSGDIKVGFPKSLSFTYPNGATIVEVATYNEFGTEFIPERSFLRATFQTKKTEYKSLFRKLGIKIMKGEIATKVALDLLGQKAVGDVKEFMVELSEPENDKYTIRKKGSSNPLIDTGKLMQSVTYEVVK